MPARRYVQIVDELPVRETALVQLGTGDPTLTSAHAVGVDIQVSRVRSSPMTTGYLVPKRGWTIVLMPLSWKGSYILNGREIDLGDILIVGDENGYAGTGAGRDLLGVLIRNDRFLPAVTALSGQPGLVLRLQDRSLSLSPVNGER